MNKISYIILLLILIIQCKDEYDFNTVNRAGLLVIDGSISDLPGPYFLNLGLTVSAHRRPDPVLNASILITDELGNAESYFSLGNGKYQLNGTSVIGRPGGSYTVSISLSDGRVYRSLTETIPTNSKPADSLYFSVDESKVISSAGIEVNNWNVNVYLSTKFGSDNLGYFRWSVDEVYSLFPTCWPGAISCPPICYIYQPISVYNLFVVDRRNYSGNSIKNIHLEARNVDYSFATRHYFNVVMHSMNSSTYSYWKKVQQLTTNRGSIFDSPPYTIAGNIKNINDTKEIVLGYFEASGQKMTRLFVDRGYIPTFVQTCFPNLPQDFIPNTNFCSDCTGLAGASIQEPYWFWH